MKRVLSTLPFLVFISLVSFRCYHQVDSESSTQGHITLGSFLTTLPLSTYSDSAIFYYDKGWEAIMDFGQYTLSEEYFRKAIAFDSSFLLAQCQVARLSKDEVERNKILKLIDATIEETQPDERLMIENFKELIILTNLGASADSTIRANQLKKALNLSENNLRSLVRKYPNEVYHNCEYIEVIHYNHGPKAALDTLSALDNEELRTNLFLNGYSVLLNAELKDFEKAQQLVENLEKAVSSELPKIHVVKSQLADQKGHKKKALTHANKALEIDPGNIDAQRLKAKNQ